MAGKNSLGRGRRWYDEPIDLELRRRSALTKVLPWVFSPVIILVVLVLWRWAEPYLMPVVSNYDVAKVDLLGDDLILSGTLYKDRDCQFIGISYLAEDQTGLVLLPYKFIDIDSKSTVRALRSARTGNLSWGPVEVQLPSDDWRGEIHINLWHSCWPLWISHTHLATVNLKERL